MRRRSIAAFPPLLLLFACPARENASGTVIEVETISAAPSQISRTIEFSAVIEAECEAFLVSPGGLLSFVAVSEGDSVDTGDTVAVMTGDAALSTATLAAGEELRAALAGAARAANEAARIRELHRAGAVSETAMLGAMTASGAARAEVEAARHARAAALALERTCMLRAPFDGVVGSVGGRSGAMTSPGEVVAVVTGGGLVARLLVPERQLAGIRPGMLSVFAPAVAEYAPIEGLVESVAGSVDPMTGLVPVTVRFSASGHRQVRSGVSGVVSIELARAEGAVVIPADAIVMTGGTMQVPVLLEDGTLDFREVVTGIRSGDSIQVVSGIEFGDEVVIRSSAPISPGVSASRTRS